MIERDQPNKSIAAQTSTEPPSSRSGHCATAGWSSVVRWRSSAPPGLPQPVTSGPKKSRLMAIQAEALREGGHPHGWPPPGKRFRTGRNRCIRRAGCRACGRPHRCNRPGRRRGRPCPSRRCKHPRSRKARLHLEHGVTRPARRACASRGRRARPPRNPSSAARRRPRAASRPAPPAPSNARFAAPPA